MSSNSRKSSRADRGKPAIEWIAGAASGLIVIGLLGFLAHQAFFEDGSPPRLAVSIDSVEPGENRTVVRVAVKNSGDRAAAGVRVIGRVEDSAPREIEFDYIAGNEKRHGAFMFSGNLDQNTPIQVEVGGYTDP